MTLQDIADFLNHTFARLGIKYEGHDMGSEYVAMLHIPAGVVGFDDTTIVAREPYPSLHTVGALEDMVGAHHRGKIRRKLKKGIKKIAKNKVFRALGKAALAVTPGGRAVRAALSSAHAAAHAVKKGKKHGAAASDGGDISQDDVPSQDSPETEDASFEPSGTMEDPNDTQQLDQAMDSDVDGGDGESDAPGDGGDEPDGDAE